MPALNRLFDALGAQQARFFYWSPVFLSVGIGSYFVPFTEPSVGLFAIGSGLIALLLTGARWFGPRVYLLRIACFALALICFGFVLMGVRSYLVAAPVLKYRYYGPIEGQIIHIDRSASDKIRLTLEDIKLDRLPPYRVPKIARISIHSELPDPPLRVGEIIETTGLLSPPRGPVEPGGFDFRRHAWYLQIGAQGYTRKPVIRLGEAEYVGPFAQLRTYLSERIKRQLPGDTGGFAAALLTGDRSGLTAEMTNELRISNLAHILAISGLHMGLVAGLVFGSLRFVMALIPYIALRWSVKKTAAVGALFAGAFYLGLSGASIATQRAFIMTAVALGAVLLNRRVFSLRSVAVAAWIVLLIRPESLLNPGFQMSFAATTVLVVVYSYLSKHPDWLGPRWLRPVTTLMLTSACAGAATAPVAAAHFNQIASYGFIANQLAMPAMAGLVMPSGVAALLLMPLGLDGVALWVMGQGLDWILWVAHWVSGLPNARLPVVQPGAMILPMIATGALFVMLWAGLGRWIGLVAMCVGLGLWQVQERPNILIANSGGLVGIMTETGRALSTPVGDKFTARIWLENDGDAATREEAYARWQELSATSELPLRAIKGKARVAEIAACESGELLVLSHNAEQDLPCEVLDPDVLRNLGAVLAHQTDQGWEIIPALRPRLWNQP